MQEEKVLDLTNLYGFARLYKTLVQDGGGKRSTSDMLYGCYLANISACNKKGPKLVYVSAPLRGDVEKNIAFAKEKAREVFLEGNIPVCPHLMFPPIADPRNAAEDKAAMEMCLKLLERCSEMRVYGPIWSEGMWQEIRHAEKLKIPIKTDQQEIPRTRRVQPPCR